MKRSKLHNDFLKGRNDAFESAYRKQRNLCVSSSKTPVGIKVSNITIMSEEAVKLLEIHIDNRLNFSY